MYISFTLSSQEKMISDLPVEKRLPLIRGIQLLDTQSKELRASHEEIEVRYQIYYEKDQELPTLEGSLPVPFANDSAIQAIVEPLENSPDAENEAIQEFIANIQKGFPKRKKKDTKKQGNKETTTKKERIQENLSKEKRPIVRNVLISILIGLSVAVSLFALFVVEKNSEATKKANQQVTTRIMQLERKAEKQGEMDVFSRYFLANYFSGDTNEKRNKQRLQKFVNKEALKKISLSKEKAKSMLLLNVKPEGKKWNVSYVVTLQQGKETATATKKVNFTLIERHSEYRVEHIKSEDFTIIDE